MNNAPDSKVPVTLAFHLNKDGVDFTDDSNGDTVFHNVTLIAEGTWTDNHSKTATRYTASALSKMQFKKYTFKMDHDIFGQLPITNEIGIVENMQYTNNPTPRWQGDVRIFPTQNGKDTTTLLKRKHINAVSSEMYINPVEAEDGKLDATELIFMGAATVRKGACSLCKFNEGDETTTETKVAADEIIETIKPQLDAQKADVAILEAHLEEQKKARNNQVAAELEAMKKENEELRQQIALQAKQVAEQEHAKKVRELTEQIESLKREPAIHTKVVPVTYGNTYTGSIAVELDSDPEYQPVSVRDME